MTVLVTTRVAPVSGSEADLPFRHAAVSAAIAQHLTPAHAALLARPEVTPTGTAWLAPDGEWRRFADLPSDDRDRLLEAVASIRSDIRRLAESGVSPVVTAAWPTMWTMPDLSFLFAVAGRPVIAGWDLPARSDKAGAVLELPDDGQPFVPPPRTPWAVYGLTMGVLALLALSAGLLLPFFGQNQAVAPAACIAAPGQLALFAQQGRVEAQGEELRTLLAALTSQLGQRQLLCPLRVSQRPQPPPSGPAPRADLPQDRWAQRDVSLLKGCWQLTTGLSSIDSSGAQDPFTSWKMCFGADGHGQQTELTQSGKQCDGPLAAAFTGEDLAITMPERCHGTLNISPAILHCQRVDDSNAHCNGRNLVPNNSDPQFGAQFRR